MTREKAASDARPRGQKKKPSFRMTSSPNVTDCPRGRPPKERHQPCPIIVPRCCCAVKSQFCMALTLDYICPPGQPHAFVPHCDDYALHPQPALRSPEPPTGAAGRGGAGGQAVDYAEGPAGKAAAGPPRTDPPLAQHHDGGPCGGFCRRAPGLVFRHCPRCNPRCTTATSAAT